MTACQRQSIVVDGFCVQCFLRKSINIRSPRHERSLYSPPVSSVMDCVVNLDTCRPGTWEALETNDRPRILVNGKFLLVSDAETRVSMRSSQGVSFGFDGRRVAARRAATLASECSGCVCCLSRRRKDLISGASALDLFSC